VSRRYLTREDNRRDCLRIINGAAPLLPAVRCHGG
jgi:hypothetical protein